MRILLVTMHYAPEPNFITRDLAESLAMAGNSVIVLTSYPNYPAGQFYKNSFRPYVTSRRENKVLVIRVPHFPSHSGSSIVRLASYLSFILTSIIPSLLLGVIFRPHRAIVYQTPFFTAMLAIPLKILGTHITYICADLWPESLIAANKSGRGLITKALFAYSRAINLFANNIITSTRGMKDRYIKDGISPNNIEFIPVWVDGIPDPLPPPFALGVGKKQITFAGNIGISQGLEVFVRAFSTPEVRALDVELHIVGVGSELERLRNMAKDLSNVVFRGRVDPYEAFRIQRESAAVIAHLIPSPQFEMTLPSKLSVCLAVGNVFLCGINGEANNMFLDCPSVITFKSGDFDAIVDKILYISSLSKEEIAEMGAANQEIYQNRFSKKSLLQRYLDLCLI